MKKQVTCNIQLPPYVTASLYNDGFCIKVTRQICKDDVEDFKETLKYFGQPRAEVFTYCGRAYISCRKVYMYIDGMHPTHPQVLADAKEMHKFLMERIINHKIYKLTLLLDNYA